ncbi:hypothetical protein [Halosegnis rubeus]|jgi:hypothetical protein|nr:hypothetical protein [Halosegnis rubeus]
MMQKAVLLRCPICDSVRTLEGERNRYAKNDLYKTAKNHLASHNLDETKSAIRKCEIVSDAVEIVIYSEDHDPLPNKEWKQRNATWLPENVLDRVDTSNPSPESSADTTPIQLHNED